jgi:hypothetical protein
MKKLMILALAAILVTGVANAQGFYLRLGVGAGYGLAYYDGYTGTYTSTLSSYSIEVKSINLGTGGNINFGAGYMFSKYVGAEFGINEFLGFAKTYKSDMTQTYYSRHSEYKTGAKSLQIVPALVVTPGLEKVNPYGRFGIIIGVMNTITETGDETETTNPVTTKATSTESYKNKLYGGVAIGVAAAVGAEFNLSNSIALYAEIDYNGLNYSPKKGKKTEWTIDGVDQLPNAKTIDKEWVYVKKYDSSENIPDTDPDKVTKSSVPLSNVGINFGVKFRLGSGK